MALAVIIASEVNLRFEKQIKGMGMANGFGSHHRHQ
jgi:hypothetical protein